MGFILFWGEVAFLQKHEFHKQQKKNSAPDKNRTENKCKHSS